MDTQISESDTNDTAQKISRVFDKNRTWSGCSWNSISKETRVCSRCILTVGLCKGVCRFNCSSSSSSLLSFSPLPGGSFQSSLVPLKGLYVAAMCFSIIYLCFLAQTIRPPDRKSPSGQTTALCNTQLQTEAVATTEYVTMWCVFGACTSFVFSSDSYFLVVSCLWMLCQYAFEPEYLGLCFILQQDFDSVMWFPQFIHHQWYLYFHPTGMSPTVRDTSPWASGWWLVI